MNRTPRSLSSIVSTALVFSAGVALAGPARNAYSVVRERVIREPAAVSDIGACRYDALTNEQKETLGVRALDEQPSILGTYARRVGKRAWNELLYTTTMLEKEGR